MRPLKEGESDKPSYALSSFFQIPNRVSLIMQPGIGQYIGQAGRYELRTWRTLLIPQTSTDAVAIEKNTKVIYAADFSLGVYLSPDRGGRSYSINNGLTA